MKQQSFSYQQEIYNVITVLEINHMQLVISANHENNYSCFKHKKLNGRSVYTPFHSLIKVLPQYQTIAMQNIDHLIESFISGLESNKDLEKLERAFHEIAITSNALFSEEVTALLPKEYFDAIFEVKIQTSERRSVSQLLELEAKEVTKKEEVPPTKVGFPFQKFAYMLLVVISFVGFMNCYSAYATWKEEGKEVKKAATELIADANIQEEVGGEVVENVEPTTNENTNKNTNTNSNQSKKKSTKTNDYWSYIDTPMLSVDFNNLKKKNQDTVAWLYVNNTNVNYPVVQTTNNSYYLNHAFDRSSNSAGWVFGDYRSDFTNFDRNTVIYGHRRKDLTMFGSLGKTIKKDWYTNKDNQIIKLSTPTENTLWQIFSIYTIKEESYYLTHDFENDAAYESFLKKLTSRSIYNFGVKTSKDDKILTLSTCLNLNGDRIVIHAKLVKTQKR